MDSEGKQRKKINEVLTELGTRLNEISNQRQEYDGIVLVYIPTVDNYLYC